MKKTILAVILLAVATVTTVIAQESARNFQYDLNEAKNGIVINKYIGSNSNLVIPRTIEGYPVVEIGYNETIAPNNLLVSLVIPEGVRLISCDFSNQKNLTSVTLPSTLRYICSYAFSKTGLRTVRIPDSVVEIAFGAFMDCVNLTDVNIPAGIKIIGGEVFRGCSRLSNVTIPASIKSIEWDRYDRYAQAYDSHRGFEGCALTIAARQRLTQLGYDDVQNQWAIYRGDVQANYYDIALVYYNRGNYYAGLGEVSLARSNYGTARFIIDEALGRERANQNTRTLDAELKKKVAELRR